MQVQHPVGARRRIDERGSRQVRTAARPVGRRRFGSDDTQHARADDRLRLAGVGDPGVAQLAHERGRESAAQPEHQGGGQHRHRRGADVRALAGPLDTTSELDRGRAFPSQCTLGGGALASRGSHDRDVRHGVDDRDGFGLCERRWTKRGSRPSHLGVPALGDRLDRAPDVGDARRERNEDRVGTADGTKGLPFTLRVGQRVEQGADSGIRAQLARLAQRAIRRRQRRALGPGQQAAERRGTRGERVAPRDGLRGEGVDGNVRCPGHGGRPGRRELCLGSGERHLRARGERRRHGRVGPVFGTGHGSACGARRASRHEHQCHQRSDERRAAHRPDEPRPAERRARARRHPPGTGIDAALAAAGARHVVTWVIERANTRASSGPSR